MPINPSFRLLLLINFYLTSFYQRWYPQDAHLHAAMVTPLLLFFNGFEIKLIIDAFSDPVPPTGMVLGDTLLSGQEEACLVVLPAWLFLALVNYILVFRRQKHHDYFLRLSHERTDILHRDFFVFVGYFLLTVVPIGYWLVHTIASKP